MLPDFPEEKKIFRITLNRALRAHYKLLLGPLSQIKAYAQHEGHRLAYEEHGLGMQDKPLLEASSPLEWDMKELDRLSGTDVLKKLEAATRDVASQVASDAYETIGDAVRRVGNVLDAQGRSISVDLILDALDKTDIDFDEQGKPHLPTLVVHPSLAEKLSKLAPDQAANQRLDAILWRKWEAWRDREANRKLVD